MGRVAGMFLGCVVVVVLVVVVLAVVEDECVLGLGRVAGMFLGCVVVVVLEMKYLALNQKIPKTRCYHYYRVLVKSLMH